MYFFSKSTITSIGITTLIHICFWSDTHMSACKMPKLSEAKMLLEISDTLSFWQIFMQKDLC